jgi:CubicO group peptidase (beta-lactamase class C family)
MKNPLSHHQPAWPGLSFSAWLLLALCLLGGTATSRAQTPQPLQLVCPGDFFAPACSTAPVVVVYPPIYAVGDCATNVLITCAPPSGSLFPLGETTVTCTALDPCGGRSACSFKVTVAMDTTPPTLTPPTNRVVFTANGTGAYVDYGPWELVDAGDPNVLPVFAPASGSFFPLGTNLVLFSAVDQCGNSNGVTFKVEVRKAKVNAGLLPDGMQITWEADGLECADDLIGPWEPAGGSSGTGLFPTDGAAKFFRPAPGVDHGIPLFRGAEIAYVETGLHDQPQTPGVTLRRLTDDAMTTGGSLVLAANAGGGTDVNVWSGEISIPFKFWFYGQPRTRLCVSKNGLATFSTEVAGQSVGSAATPRALPNRFWPPDTVACFQSAFLPLDATNHVRAYLYGTQPNRQVWFVWHGHEKTRHGHTHTALVLEETSNRLLMVDMAAEFPQADGPGPDEDDMDPLDPLVITTPPTDALLAVGVQRDTNAFTQVSASPQVQLVNASVLRPDNDFYVFKPYQVGRHHKGSGVGALSFIDPLVFAKARDQNLPGLTLAVTYQGRLIYNKSFGYADVERDIEMQPHHRAHIGSVTKILTATDIFKLVELGTLASVSNLISDPNLLGRPYVYAALQQGINDGNQNANAIAHFNQITLQHLMSHTAGYIRSGDDESVMDFTGLPYGTITYSNVIQWSFATQRFLTNGPGLLSTYSNHGFGHLGQIIEYLTGLTYEQFTKTYVLNPIGLTRVQLGKTYLSEQDPVYDARRYHNYSSGSPHIASKFTGVLGPYTYGYTKFAIGSAGSWTGTARDLARFMCATDRLPNHSDILSSASLDLMESDPVPAVGKTAHGWIREANGRLWHNGSIGYGSAYMEKNPNGVNLAVVCNTANATELGNLAGSIRAQFTPTVLAGLPKFYDLFPGQLQLAPP